MPRTYKPKNPYFKGSRLSIEQTEYLVLMYLKGVKISQCAEELGLSHVSVGKLYKKLDREMLQGFFFLEFTRYLKKKNEDTLVRLLYTVRGVLMNINRIPKPQVKHFILEKIKHTPHLAYYDGEGAYYPTVPQFKACIDCRETNTPPLVVRNMIQKGKIDEVREKRLSCRSCPMRFREIYKPPSKNKFFCENSGDNEIIYERNSVLQNSTDEIIIMWIDILWFLGHSRKSDKFSYLTKITHGAIFSALKRGEYKVSKNIVGGVGVRVPTPLLYPEQHEDVKQGLIFTSTLDVPAVYCMLQSLAKRR